MLVGIVSALGVQRRLYPVYICCSDCNFVETRVAWFLCLCVCVCVDGVTVLLDVV